MQVAMPHATVATTQQLSARTVPQTMNLQEQAQLVLSAQSGTFLPRETILVRCVMPPATNVMVQLLSAFSVQPTMSHLQETLAWLAATETTLLKETTPANPVTSLATTQALSALPAMSTTSLLGQDRLAQHVL